MKAAFKQSDLRSANIGIFSKVEKDGNVSYDEGGSGVIFKKENGSYYTLTAARVVSVENAQLLVYTVNTEMKSESIPGIDYNVLTQDTYNAMYTADIEYISKRDNLAVIKFTADEELAVTVRADKDLQKEDRIICVGNPQNEWFVTSFGKVTSGVEKFGETHGFPSNAMKHSAYIQVGSSDVAAFNENMKLVGITPGGSYSLDGKDFNYGVLIPVSEIQICLNEWEKQ